ncbi:hypothetical protein M409DRAFT_58056 [Zasmidium cellare ATCC 36951]|uniref:Uncharacterized protein n=1 Tax=Zasmidium cellare ATCC 36951 TaxID=1080233 RepID=A0A6A6C642_ZASCE|nr:uncharacterized protein M409DRAFT_58056 [Zasmidium cellare ATCC 36951]KAF2162637.1 hypothetical protein M409DRAFT_58056 [Zasmidium cellare ATCC 36951]
MRRDSTRLTKRPRAPGSANLSHPPSTPARIPVQPAAACGARAVRFNVCTYSAWWWWTRERWKRVRARPLAASSMRCSRASYDVWGDYFCWVPSRRRIRRCSPGDQRPRAGPNQWKR